MIKKQIELDFGSFVLDAKLFDTDIARKFAENLPYAINLMQWGKELYGSIEINFGEENPVSTIPPGGIAYTNNGNYVCIFFGQTPAWPVEYIGHIISGQWKHLVENSSNNSVIIKAK
mmetsp:Transcript_1278/g.920  ORF Transcript_1278/g.920 Transcript_1278/m.920 type:complete len:117 (-) Transcript_1278:189-539(-)